MAERWRVQLGYVKAIDAMIVAMPDRFGNPAWLRDETGEITVIASGMLGSARRAEAEEKFSQVDRVFNALAGGSP